NTVVKDMKPSDILPLLKAGDRKAFEAIYRLYSNNLYIIAYSYISDKYLAEDLVQEVFVRLWENRERLNISSNINGYLFMMIRNKCLDHLRKPRSTVFIEADDEDIERMLNYYALQDEGASRLIETELEKSINEAIELLPEACKAVFLKTRIEGLKYREAANELNISVKTVESHMTRALKHMRVYLKEFLSGLL